MTVNAVRVTAYIALTYAFSWSMGFVGLAAIGTFGPAIVAILLQRLVNREPIRGPLGIRFCPNRWFVVALAIPLLLSVATFGVGLLIPGVRYSPTLAGWAERQISELGYAPDRGDALRSQYASFGAMPAVLVSALLLNWLRFGPTTGALLGFGEEVGWRGYLYKELRSLGFWRSSYLIGFVWGLWHAPAILGHWTTNYPQHPVEGMVMMTGWGLLSGPLYSYVRLRSASAIATTLMHGAAYSTPLIAIILLEGGSDLTIGVYGLSGLLVLALANLCLYRLDPSPRERESPPPRGSRVAQSTHAVR